MHYSSYQRCIAVLFIFSLLLQSCKSNSRAVMDESSPHPGTPATASIPSMAIGPKEWAQYFGEVGEAPPLPADIDKILESRCSFWPAKQVKDTHLLVLVPATVDGQPFTLDLLEKLIKQGPKEGGNKTDIDCDPSVRSELGGTPTRKSYWVLMTRDVFEDSRHTLYDLQEQLVVLHARLTNLPYELPKALEAATAILLHHARTGECLYTNPSRTYTQCQEKVDENQDPVFVGGFSSRGLFVHSLGNHDYRSDDYGVSCLRRF
jgi:hypothetical protein